MKKLFDLGVPSMYQTQEPKAIVSFKFSHNSISNEPDKNLFASLDIAQKLLYWYFLNVPKSATYCSLPWCVYVDAIWRFYQEFRSYSYTQKCLTEITRIVLRNDYCSLRRNWWYFISKQTNVVVLFRFMILINLFFFFRFSYASELTSGKINIFYTNFKREVTKKFSGEGGYHRLLESKFRNFIFNKDIILWISTKTIICRKRSSGHRLHE